MDKQAVVSILVGKKYAIGIAQFSSTLLKYILDKAL